MFFFLQRSFLPFYNRALHGRIFFLFGYFVESRFRFFETFITCFFFFLAEGWDTIVRADIFENVNGGFRNRSSV